MHWTPGTPSPGTPSPVSVTTGDWTTIRQAGWRGQGPVPWSHQPNQGFLRALNALRRSALAIGEPGEPERCRDFLRQLDTSDHFGVTGS